MARTTPPPVRRTSPNPRPTPAPRSSAVATALTLLAAAAVAPAVAQELPPRQNRPAGEPPPATRPAVVEPAIPEPVIPAPFRRVPGPVIPIPLVPDPPPFDREAADREAAAAAAAREAADAAAGPVTAKVRADLAKAFADLADAEPAAREAARVKLMGTPRRHLPALQAVVHDSLPLAPAQATVLREIVTHAYLAGEPYLHTGGLGFLGVRLAEVNVGDRPEAPPEGAPAADAPRAADLRIRAAQAGRLPGGPFDPDALGMAGSTAGVLIVERMPGFCGARMFRDGDVVLGLTFGGTHYPTHSTGTMADAVRQFGTGQVVRFEVLRQGQVIRVPVTLDPRPDEAEPFGSIQGLLDTRRRAIDAYWAEAYAPMLREKAG